MLTLSLDTTTRRGSVALLRPDGTVDCLEGDAARTHGERLPAEIIALLSRNNLHLTDVNLYAVAAGPGSFTGLRIGIATMQGFALVNGRPLIGVSALDALAHAAATHQGIQTGDLIGVWIDAHRREVFSALYRVGKDAPAVDEGSRVEKELTAVDAASVSAPADILKQWGSRPDFRGTWLTGDGVETYSEAVADAAGIRPIVPAPPLAPTVARLAVAMLCRGDLGSPHALRPIYVRRPDAELARERRVRLDANEVER